MASGQLVSGKSVGTIKDFLGGLEGRIGMPSADVWQGMEDEHLHMSNRCARGGGRGGCWGGGIG